MLNFNTNIQEVIANQETAKRTHAFVEYNSKKKLFEAGVLDESKQAYISQIKGTFTFHLHKDNRYLVVTLYHSTTKEYGFKVVDLETLMCADADSVKNAKKDVMELVAAQSTVNTVEEQAADTIVDETKPTKQSKKNSK